MQYTDEELRRWWDSKTKSDQADIIDTMVETCDHSDFTVSIQQQHTAGRQFSPKQLAAIRKWDHE